MLATIVTAVFTSSPIANLAIWLILVVAIVALVFLFLKVAGVQPPPWFWQAIWIVAAAIFFIFLILVLVHFANSPTPLF